MKESTRRLVGLYTMVVSVLPITFGSGLPRALSPSAPGWAGNVVVVGGWTALLVGLVLLVAKQD